METVLAELALVASGEAVRASVATFVERHNRKSDDRRGDEKREKAIRSAVNRAVKSTDDGALALHVREASGWAALVHVQGMPRPVGTEVARSL